MFSGKKHYTAQSTQPELSDKLNRYTFLEKSSAQLDEHYKKSKLLHELQIPVNRNGIFSLRFSNDNTKLISSYGNGIIDVFDMEIGKFDFMAKEAVQGHLVPIMACRCVPGENETFFAGGISGEIFYCKFEPGNCRKFCEEKLNEINSIDIDAGSSTLVSVGKDAIVRLYDIRHGKLKSKFYKSDRAPEDGSTTNFHAMRIFCTKFHPTDDHVFLTGGWDDIVKIWDVRIKEGCVRNIKGPRICGEAIDIKDKRILTGSWTVTNSLQIWDMTSGKLVENINPINRVHTLDGEFLYCCQYLKDEKREYILAASSGTSTFEIINVKELKIVSSYKAQKTIQAIDGSTNSIVTYGGMDPFINVVIIV